MGDYYSIKRVSSSSLRWFETSPRFFRMMMDKEIEQENEFIFKKGKMVHFYLLQPEEFNKNYTFLDYESPKSQQQKDFCSNVARFKKGNKEEILIRAYKECYSTKESDEKVLEKAKLLEKQYKNYIKSIKLSTVKIVLSKGDIEKLDNIKKEIANHRVANDLLIEQKITPEVYNEFEIYWEFLGIECKSMLDRVIIDKENKTVKLIDIKTSAQFSEFEEKFFEYKYHRQMAFYWLALYNHFNKIGLDITDYKKETYIIAINIKEPTEIKVYEVGELSLNWGLNEIEKLMSELKWHFDNNIWDYPKLYYEGTGTIKI